MKPFKIEVEKINIKSNVNYLEIKILTGVSFSPIVIKLSRVSGKVDKASFPYELYQKAQNISNVNIDAMLKNDIEKNIKSFLLLREEKQIAGKAVSSLTYIVEKVNDESRNYMNADTTLYWLQDGEEGVKNIEPLPDTGRRRSRRRRKSTDSCYTGWIDAETLQAREDLLESAGGVAEDEN